MTQPWGGARARLAFRGLILAAALAAAQSCGERELLTLKVSAASPAALVAWKARARDRMGPRLVGDFDDAVLEIRLRTLVAGRPDDDAARAAINGRSLRQVLQLGLGYKLRRLESEWSTLDRSLRTGSQRGSMPGDRGTALGGSDLHARQQARLVELKAGIGAIQSRLQAIREPDGRDYDPWDPALAPTPVPAEPPAIGLPAPGS